MMNEGRQTRALRLARTLPHFYSICLIKNETRRACSQVSRPILLDTERIGLIRCLMHIAKVPNRNARPSFLLRETYREDGKVKNRTLANLSRLPLERIEALRAALRGDPLVALGAGGLEIRRSLPHGHVLAALTVARRIGLADLLPRRAPQRRRDLALALIVARLLDPAAKLATARMLDSATATHSLGETLGLGSVTAREIYATLDWLGREQSFIGKQLARRPLKNSALVLYEV